MMENTINEILVKLGLREKSVAEVVAEEIIEEIVTEDIEVVAEEIIEEIVAEVVAEEVVAVIDEEVIDEAVVAKSIVNDVVSVVAKSNKNGNPITEIEIDESAHNKKTAKGESEVVEAIVVVKLKKDKSISSEIVSEGELETLKNQIKAEDFLPATDGVSVAENNQLKELVSKLGKVIEDMSEKQVEMSDSMEIFLKKPVTTKAETTLSRSKSTTVMQRIEKFKKRSLK